MQSAKRPSVDELEKIPRVRALMKEAQGIIREYTFNHQLSAKQRELRSKEEELARREAVIAAAERSLKEREAALVARLAEVARREAALAARAGTLADDEHRRLSMGDRPRTASFSGSAAQPAPLLRHHSLPEVLQSGPSVNADVKRVRSISGQALPPYVATERPTIDTSVPSSRPGTASSISSASSAPSIAVYCDDTEMTTAPSSSIAPRSNGVSGFPPSFAGAKASSADTTTPHSDTASRAYGRMVAGL